MTEPELQQERAHSWHVDGNPIRTLEDACGFLDTVGFCLLFPERSLNLPVFLAAHAGTADGLPDAKHAFSDPRTRPALELVTRLLRERKAYEIPLPGDAVLLIAAPFFPFFYAMLGDRNAKAPPSKKAQGGRISPLGMKIFETLQKHGPLSAGKLQELIGRELTIAALERALHELWSVLKVVRAGSHELEGATWDLLYRWSPEAVKLGAHLSAAESLSTLVNKYVEAAFAAGQEEIEQFFSNVAPRFKIREAIHALLAAQELRLITVSARPLLQAMSASELEFRGASHSRGMRESRETIEPRGSMVQRDTGESRIIIAIDGPAGSGKSTLAALLARRYHYVNIETGAMYRALALKALEEGISLEDGPALGRLADRIQIELCPHPDGNRVLLDGIDVTERIRRQEVTDAASRASVHPAVRTWMVEHQRAMGKRGGVVMEGRDIGTKVFPEAEVKIFLDAAPEVRGSRRFLQNPAAQAAEKSVLDDLRARDLRDSTRAHAPLAAAHDAVSIDSTRLTLEQVFQRAVEIVDSKLKELREHEPLGRAVR